MAKAIASSSAYHMHSHNMDLDFGRLGFIYTNDTSPVTASTGEYIHYIEVQENNTQFAASGLLVVTDSLCSIDGNDITGVNLARGTILRGVFSGYTLAQGSVIAYKAKLLNWEQWYNNISRKNE